MGGPRERPRRSWTAGTVVHRECARCDRTSRRLVVRYDASTTRIRLGNRRAESGEQTQDCERPTTGLVVRAPDFAPDLRCSTVRRWHMDVSKGVERGPWNRDRNRMLRRSDGRQQVNVVDRPIAVLVHTLSVETQGDRLIESALLTMNAAKPAPAFDGPSADVARVLVAQD